MKKFNLVFPKTGLASEIKLTEGRWCSRQRNTHYRSFMRLRVASDNLWKSRFRTLSEEMLYSHHFYVQNGQLSSFLSLSFDFDIFTQKPGYIGEASTMVLRIEYL